MLTSGLKAGHVIKAFKTVRHTVVHTAPQMDELRRLLKVRIYRYETILSITQYFLCKKTVSIDHQDLVLTYLGLFI